jgi:hypothetical protein
VQPAPGSDFVLTPRRTSRAAWRQRPSAARIASETGGRYVGMAGPRPSATPRTPTPSAPRTHRPASTHPWRRPGPKAPARTLTLRG